MSSRNRRTCAPGQPSWPCMIDILEASAHCARAEGSVHSLLSRTGGIGLAGSRFAFWLPPLRSVILQISICSRSKLRKSRRFMRLVALWHIMALCYLHLSLLHKNAICRATKISSATTSATAFSLKINDMRGYGDSPAFFTRAALGIGKFPCAGNLLEHIERSGHQKDPRSSAKIRGKVLALSPPYSLFTSLTILVAFFCAGPRSF
jgi:hypothetical protein